jgi:hypothetical protein
LSDLCNGLVSSVVVSPRGYVDAMVECFVREGGEWRLIKLKLQARESSPCDLH